MLYQVVANITGEPATVQEKEGRTEFSRGEAEDFQSSLRTSGFDRVDIIETQNKPPGTITAPASIPDRQGISIPSIQVVQDISTKQNVPYSESTQARIEENITKAVKDNPNWALQEGNVQAVRQQAYQQAQGDFGQRRVNVMPSERLQQEEQQQQAQTIAEQASRQTTAEGILTGFRQLPEAYQTPETLKSIAETSRQRQDLNNQNVFLVDYGNIGTTGRTNILDNINTNPSNQMVAQDKKEPEIKKFFFGDEGGTGLTGIPKSLITGIGQVAERVTRQVNISRVIDPFGLGIGKNIERNLGYFKTNNILESPDVKNLAIVGGLSLLPEGLGILTGIGFTGYKAYQTVKQPTAGNLGELIFMGGLGLAPKAIEKFPLKIERFQVPTEETPQTLYTGLTGTLGQRGTPLVGVSEGNIVFGTPKIELSNLKSPLIPQEYVATPAKARILTTNLPQAPSQEFSLGLPVMRTTETTPSAFVTKQFIKESKTLTPEEIIKVINLAKKDDALVYGSFAARQQVPEGILRKAGDIDLQLKLGQAETEVKVQQLANQLGNKFRVAPDNPTLIQKNVQDTGWVNAVDIHPKTEVSYGTGESIFGLQLGQKPIKIESTKVMPLSEQGLRKGASVFTLRTQEGDVLFAPESHRIKDIGDFFATQEVLLKSKIIPNPVAEAKLAELKGLFEKRFPEAFERQPEIKVPLSLEESRTPSSSRIFYSGLPSEFISMRSIPVSEQSMPILSSVSIPLRSLSPSVSIPQRPSVSPSASSKTLSPSPSTSFLGSVSPSSSNKISSSSVSILGSPSISPSISTSRSISPSPSPSKSISPSVSPSTYLNPSPSPYLSPSPSTYPSPSPSITTTITPKGKSSLSKSLSTQFKKQAYNVLIKVKQQKLAKGRYKSRGFTKANKEPLTRLAAEGLGKQIVDTYANRSFTITKAKGNPIERKDLENATSALAFKFRAAKRNKKIFVEKETYAIDNPEEVKGIPYEALRQRKAGLIQKKKQMILSKIRQKIQKKRVISMFTPTQTRQSNKNTYQTNVFKSKGRSLAWL